MLNPEGFSYETIKSLFEAKNGNYLVSDDLISFEEANRKIWEIGAEIFIPAAASRLVSKKNLDAMIAHGLEVISSGANVPFADDEIFYGPISEYADEKVSCIPDFISNCGMARVFGYLMGDNVELSDQAIFQDTSSTIKEALEKCYEMNNSKQRITKTAYEIALKQLL